MITKKVTLFLASCLVMIAGIATCLYWRYQQPKEPLAFCTEKPTRKHLEQWVTASGTLKALEQVSVGSLIAGKVQTINVDNNDNVQPHQTLAILDNGIGDSNVKKASAALQEAETLLVFQESFFARQQSLFESGQLAKNQFELEHRDIGIARTRVKQAQAALEIEQKQYNNLFIKSPIAGTVIAKRIDLGQQVTAQLQATTLFEIAKDLSLMEARVDVDEADVGLIREGQAAYFTVDAFPKQQFISHVKKIEYLFRIVDNVVTYGTILNVENPDLLLRPGMTTNVSIKVRESKNALCIPNRALRINSLKLRTYAEKNGIKLEKKSKKRFSDTLWIWENNTIVRIPVTLHTTDGKYTEITDGITEETDVIIDFFDKQQNQSFLKTALGGGSAGSSSIGR